MSYLQELWKRYEAACWRIPAGASRAATEQVVRHELAGWLRPLFPNGTPERVNLWVNNMAFLTGFGDWQGISSAIHQGEKLAAELEAVLGPRKP
jgi:hypothetical protein